MNLETIKSAIALWNSKNKSLDSAMELLNQGVSFTMDPKVEDCSPAQSNPKYIHAYPGVMNNKLYLFFINSAMDTIAAFDDREYPITNYIFSSEIGNLTEDLCNQFLGEQTQGSIDIEKNVAISRIARWNLSKKDFVNNQIENTQDGLFQGFIIPIQDLQPNSDISVIFAINPVNANPLKTVADLIVWDNTQANLISSVGGQMADLVLPIPPFGPEEEKDKKNFHLLNLSYPG